MRLMHVKRHFYQRRMERGGVERVSVQAGAEGTQQSCDGVSWTSGNAAKVQRREEEGL